METIIHQIFLQFQSTGLELDRKLSIKYNRKLVLY